MTYRYDLLHLHNSSIKTVKSFNSSKYEMEGRGLGFRMASWVLLVNRKNKRIFKWATVTHPVKETHIQPFTELYQNQKEHNIGPIHLLSLTHIKLKICGSKIKGFFSIKHLTFMKNTLNYKISNAILPLFYGGTYLPTFLYMQDIITY